MNPPFTRPNIHELRIPDTPNPNFAAFGATAAEQKAMAKAAKALTKGSVAHGNAGDASTFFSLADRKLKPGGTLALVLPAVFLTGSAWEKARHLLANAYENIVAITIAGLGNSPLSFSADTAMGECLIIARRRSTRTRRAAFVVLNNAPQHTIHSMRLAHQIRQIVQNNELRCLEDGPIGGNAILIGDDIVGHAIDAPLPSSGGWKLARITDLSLAQCAYQLASKQRLWLPTQIESSTREIPITEVSAIGKIGPYHIKVSKLQSDGSGRPFDLIPLQGDTVPTYPILWAHDANRERTMSFEADFNGIPFRPQHVSKLERDKADREIATIFSSASHCHFNENFRFNSQSTSMQFTERRTIGGRAWKSIQLPNECHEKALVLWSNTLLGMLMYWWIASKQQPGRGNITKNLLRSLPILDITALSETQLQTAVRIFDETCDLPLKPLHELHIDENRKLLDRRFYGEVLGLPDSLLADNGPLDILRGKLSQEPSIRGSKPPP